MSYENVAGVNSARTKNTKLLAYFDKREAERRKQDGDRRR